MKEVSNTRRWARIVFIAALCMPSGGCYYMQAAAGQWEVSRKSEPIDDVIAEKGTSRELAERLRLIQAARKFSVDELALPDNKTYRRYADIERDFVVWNVFAAPEFSLRPRQWCFPVAGCVSYRGYFSKDAAYREAGRLEAKGFDVAVGGVSAYSTLGNFNDPILSSMLRWDDVQLVGVLFHELAHQVLYVKDDSGFNESFATAVEEIGLARWLEANGRPEEIVNYRQRRQLREELVSLVAAARDDLAESYAASIDDDIKRKLKAARFQKLETDIAAHLARSGRANTVWPGGELNNARLASISLYEGLLPAFRALFAECLYDIRCFYGRAEELSTLDKSQRDARLDALAGR